MWRSDCSPQGRSMRGDDGWQVFWFWVQALCFLLLVGISVTLVLTHQLKGVGS